MVRNLLHKFDADRVPLLRVLPVVTSYFMHICVCGAKLPFDPKPRPSGQHISEYQFYYDWRIERVCQVKMERWSTDIASTDNVPIRLRHFFIRAMFLCPACHEDCWFQKDVFPAELPVACCLHWPGCLEYV